MNVIGLVSFVIGGMGSFRCPVVSRVCGMFEFQFCMRWGPGSILSMPYAMLSGAVPAQKM